MAAKFDDSDIDHFVDEYLSGKSTHVIAQENDVSQTHMRRLLARRGVLIRPARGEGRRLSLNTDEIARLYESGVSENQIAIRLGVNRWTLTSRSLTSAAG
jgi:hypothetical protein